MLRHALRLTPCRLRAHARPFSTIPSLLSSATSAKPLKDAVKFATPPPAKPLVWTYAELHSHVNALSAGLSELAVTPSSVLLALLQPHTPEYAVLLLACARVGARLVALPPPQGVVPLDVLNDALRKYQPQMLVVGKEFAPDAAEPDTGILASVHPFVHALAPQVPLNDAAGLKGFVRLTGRPFESTDHPYLRHVVTTSDVNMRGAITFKSLLVYSGDAPEEPQGDFELLTEGGSGKTWTAAEIVAAADKVGKEVGLGKDHTERSGRVVVTPGVTDRCASGVVAAVMHESLWVSPGGEDVKQVSEAEDAVVV